MTTLSSLSCYLTNYVLLQVTLNSMAFHKYKVALNQRSLSEDRRWSASPQSSDIQLNAGDSSFATASIRAIKKDLVKEQRKQFEQKEESHKGGLANRAGGSLKKANIQKSKSYLFLNQDQDQGKQFRFQDTDSVPKGVTFESGRNCQSVLVGQRLNLFNNAGQSNENVGSVATKPSIRPKPERLSVKRPSISSDDGKSVSSLAVAGRDDVKSVSSLAATQSSIGRLSPSSIEFLSPAAKDTNYDANEVHLSSSPVGKASALTSRSKIEYSPKPDFVRHSPSDSKSVKRKEPNCSGLGKYFDSPDVGSILSSDTSFGSKSADEGKTPKIKCSDGQNYKLVKTIGENSTAVANVCNVSAKVGDCLNKSSVKPEGISPPPPPKPPRVLSELNQSPLSKPSNEQSIREVKPSPPIKQVPKTGTYEHLKEAISVVKASEGLAISKQVSLKPSLSPSIDIKNSPVKTELPNPPKKQPADRSKMDQWWESKFIRAPPTAAPRKKENFTTKRINNPTYMYAKVGQPDDIISGRGHVRHHSDELLDASPLHSKRIGSLKLRYNDGPIYHNPSDVVEGRRALIEKVAFDKDGYAVPRVIQDAAGSRVRIFSSLLY